MPQVIVYRTEQGTLAGLGEKGVRAFDKFKRQVDELEVGETVIFSYKLPRSRKHHGFFFSKLRELFDRQEKFEDQDHLLEWLKVGAGHCELLPGAHGLVAIPKSIAWDELEEQGFIEFARAMNDFMWTDIAMETLWPHLPLAARRECVQNWHDSAEENRQRAIMRMHEDGRM